MPTWAGLLKPKGLRLGPLKSTYNAEHYAGYGGLSLVVLALLAVKMRVAAQNHEKKFNKTLYFGVQGHPKSLLSVPIERACTTSYW